MLRFSCHRFSLHMCSRNLSFQRLAFLLLLNWRLLRWIWLYLLRLFLFVEFLPEGAQVVLQDLQLAVGIIRHSCLVKQRCRPGCVFLSEFFISVSLVERQEVDHANWRTLFFNYYRKMPLSKIVLCIKHTASAQRADGKFGLVDYIAFGKRIELTNYLRRVVFLFFRLGTNVCYSVHAHRLGVFNKIF